MAQEGRQLSRGYFDRQEDSKCSTAFDLPRGVRTQRVTLGGITLARDHHADQTRCCMRSAIIAIITIGAACIVAAASYKLQPK